MCNGLTVFTDTASLYRSAHLRYDHAAESLCAAFDEFKQQSVPPGAIIQSFKSDNGGDYISQEFTMKLQQANTPYAGPRREFSTPHIHEQNSIAESSNHTIKDSAQSIIAEMMI